MWAGFNQTWLLKIANEQTSCSKCVYAHCLAATLYFQSARLPLTWCLFPPFTTWERCSVLWYLTADYVTLLGISNPVFNTMVWAITLCCSVFMLIQLGYATAPLGYILEGNGTGKVSHVSMCSSIKPYFSHCITVCWFNQSEHLDVTHLSLWFILKGNTSIAQS